MSDFLNDNELKISGEERPESEQTPKADEVAVPDNNDETKGFFVNENAVVNDEEIHTKQTEQGTDAYSVPKPQSEPEAENSFNQPYTPMYNPVNFTPVEPINDYRPMNKGLKVFAAIMAAVILLTGSCVAGYFMGRSSVKVSNNSSKPKVNLAARPEDTDEMTSAQIYEKVNNSIVGILTYNSEGDGGNASGIVYSKDGYIVTNDHIYAEVSSPKFKIYTADGKEYDAEYVAGDKISDLAVLKVKGGEFEPAVFGDSDELFAGQNVVAIGRPNGAENESTITNGIVSSVNERVQNATNYSARLIQTNCAINPGNSGGALVDMYGHIIGVTASKLAGTVYDNVGYAIPTTVMKRIVDELIKEGKVVSRAKLGITYSAVNSALAEINGYKNTGLLIATVAEDSGLYGKAEAGDFITHINGTEVTRDDIVLDIIEKCSAGDKISVTIVTASGEQKTVEAVLKANIGESSYTTEAIPDAESGGNSGGTFDFPFGE